MMNLANPEEAFGSRFIPNDGVGLARDGVHHHDYIKIHPLALLELRAARRCRGQGEIDRLTAGYADKPQFFVDKLAEGVAMIAAAFYPKDVISA
jgi:pyruvate, water dikinase